MEVKFGSNVFFYVRDFLHSIRSSIMAMPEKEKPPAMPVDILSIKKPVIRP